MAQSVMRWITDWMIGVRIPARARQSPLLHSSHILLSKACWEHLSWGVKRQERDDDTRSRMMELYLHCPYVSMLWLLPNFLGTSTASLWSDRRQLHQSYGLSRHGNHSTVSLECSHMPYIIIWSMNLVPIGPAWSLINLKLMFPFS
jgi:hypothetical protein